MASTTLVNIFRRSTNFIYENLGRVSCFGYGHFLQNNFQFIIRQLSFYPKVCNLITKDVIKWWTQNTRPLGTNFDM
jgi:hypothetical protein